MRLRWLLALLALVPGTAQAEWVRGESTHYILYSNESQAAARKELETLEKYAFILEHLSGRPLNKEPVKIKLFFVNSTDQVVETMPWPAYGVAGYYNDTPRGPFLVAPHLGRARDTSGASKFVTRGMDYNLVVFHELAHHFMFQNFTAAYPTWYSEGYADFYGTFQLTATDKGDQVLVGQPHEWRLEQIANTPWLPLRKLLTARNYGDVGDDIGMLYSEGWLLVHYAANNPKRGAQLTQYLAGINRGLSYEVAAKQAFGDDLDVLDRELRAYTKSGKINVYSYSFKQIDPGAIEVRRMTPAEAALWNEEVRLYSGIPTTGIGAAVTATRAQAKPFPNDPYAQMVLTETEALAGNHAQAEAALARWLAAAPNDPVALMHRGEFKVAALRDAKVPASDPRWDEARGDILAANKLNKTDPRIYRAYYDSFVAAGIDQPPAGAQNALVRGWRIAPDNEDLRIQVAEDYERRGMIDEAIATIRPAAFELKPDSEKSAKDKAKDARERKKYALAGERYDETPREVYDRLVKKKTGDTAAAATPAP